MNKLHIFGDSFSANDWYSFLDVKKWMECMGSNELPLSWSDILKNKLGYELENHAVGGSSNDEIFDKIINKSISFKKNDIVIVNWTHLHRFRLVNFDTDQWTRLSLNVEKTNFDKNMINFIGHNQTHRLQIQKIYDRENMLLDYSYVKGFNIFFWSVDHRVILDLPTTFLSKKQYIMHDTLLEVFNPFNGHRNIEKILNKFGGGTIEQETNGCVEDSHFGQKGHEILSNLFYEYIIKFYNKND